MIFVFAAFMLLAAMTLVLVRLFRGPSLHDRVLAANSFGTKSVLLLAVLGFYSGRPEFPDIALLYTLLTFASTIAVLKFFRFRRDTGGRDA